MVIVKRASRFLFDLVMAVMFIYLAYLIYQAESYRVETAYQNYQKLKERENKMKTLPCRFDKTTIRCELIENLGFQGGDYVSIVRYLGKSRTVIKVGTVWMPKAMKDKINFSSRYEGQ